MSLSQLVYISDTSGMTSAGLEAIITRCRLNNEARQITGILLYSAGHFIQLLEGEQNVLDTLFGRIRVDDRHFNVQQLHFATCRHRLFPDWRMGLLNLDAINDLDRRRLRGMIDRMTGAPTGLTVLGLLREFRDQLPANDGQDQRAA